MNERTFDYNSLSERISAQTEAAVEFSNALVRIIEQTAAIRDKINDSNGLVKDELRTINSKVQDILSEYNKLHSENHSQHMSFEKDIESLEEKIKNYEKLLQELLESTEINFSTLNNSVADLIKYSKRTLDQITSSNQLNMQEFAKASDSQNRFMQEVQEEIKKQNVYFGEFQKELLFAKILFWVFGASSTILGLLTALKIVNISWFNK
jgi:hypothetical protein